jgi:hypothetical protein
MSLVFSFLFDSVKKSIEVDTKKRTMTPMNWDKAGLFLGICSYAYESIGTLFNSK